MCRVLPYCRYLLLLQVGVGTQSAVTLCTVPRGIIHAIVLHTNILRSSYMFLASCFSWYGDIMSRYPLQSAETVSSTLLIHE
jgi:hypothetical protein